MNTTSEDIGIMQHFGNCLEAVPTYILTTYHNNPEKKNENTNNDDGVSFFNMVRSFFEEKVSQFSHHLRNGTLYFTPKLGVISIDRDDLINEIKRTNPYLVSWSNICDYIDPKEFHAIARRISGPDTVHYLHSCNWAQRVYGTDIYDINQSVRLFYYCIGLLRIERSHSLLIGVRRQGVYHVRDICNTELARKYVKNYLRYFFRGQDVVCGCFNGNTPLKMCSPFTRNIETAFFMFAYRETGITFKRDNYYYLKDDNDETS